MLIWGSVNWYDSFRGSRSNAGQSPVRHLPELTNIMHVSAGPPGAVLLKEGNNDLGDVGKLYLFK